MSNGESILYLRAVAAIGTERRIDAGAVSRFLLAIGRDRVALEALAINYLTQVVQRMAPEAEAIPEKGQPLPADKATQCVPNPGNPIAAEGQTSIADQGPPKGADRSKPHDDGAGCAARAGKVNESLPSPSSPSSRSAGQSPRAKKATPSVPTGREPSPLDRAAMLRARTSAAIEVWHSQRVKSRDNRPWADIAVGELRAIVVENTRDAAIAKRLLAEVPMHTDTLKTVAEALPLSAFQRALQGASEAVEEALRDVR